jgi:large subunit ribosomal protein L30
VALAAVVADGAAAVVTVADAAEGEATVAKSKETSKGKEKDKKTLKITWVRSAIGYSKDQRATIQTLGLHRLNGTVEQPDNPQVRGQVNKVKHMVTVEEL